MATESERARIERLVRENVPLALSACTKLLPKYRHRIDVEDMAQAAMLGMTEAAIRYDESAGEFSTYAMHWIRYEIFAALRRSGSVTMPERLARKRGAAWPRIAALPVDLVANQRADPHAAAEAADEIEAHLKALPEIERKALELRFGLAGGDEMTIRAVAARMKISTTAASIRITRGLQMLRQELTAPARLHA
jgi:RNA polymerase sporulation-specific sigma factor